MAGKLNLGEIKSPFMTVETFERFLGRLKSESVDLVVTDPPYWTLEKWRNVGTTTRLGGHRKKNQQDNSKWFPVINKDDLLYLLNELWRILKWNTHAYIFCDYKTYRVIADFTDDMHWRKVKPLVWNKMAPGMGYTYRCLYEMIVFLEKGTRRLNSLSIPDVLTVKKVTKGYPTEKPVELVEIFIEQSSNPGDVICDPFFGSGSVAVACRNLHRRFIGCDINPKAYEYFKRRN